MGRPLSKQQLFDANSNNNIKVQFHNGTSSVKGYIVEQTGSKRFKCKDANGTTAVCYLVDKASADLAAGEMTISFKYDDLTVQQAIKIARHKATFYYDGSYQSMPWGFATSTTDGIWQIEEAGTDSAMTSATDLEGDDGYNWTAPSGWAGYEIFNGTTQRLSVPASADWAVGTGAFTVEFVLNFTAGGSSFPRVFSVGNYPTAAVACSIEGGATPTIYFWIGGSVAASADTTDPAFTGMPSFVGNWHHVVLQRNSSGWCNIWIDGNLVTNNQTANTDNINNSSDPLAIAVEPQGGGTYSNWMKGNLTNFRWTNAQVYSHASFPVMSSALTALPQTKLLMLMASSGAALTDSSTSAKTVTGTGSPTWSAA